MLKRWVLGVLGFVLVTSCGDSCACKGGGEGQEPAQSPQPKLEPAAATGAPAATAVEAASATQGDLRFVPMPDSPLKKALADLGARVDVRGRLGPLQAPEKMGAVLASRLGAFTAVGASRFSTRRMLEMQIPVATREYASGSKKLRIKITDTAEIPGVRQEIVEQLTQLGTATTGNQRGVVVHGAPAVHAHHAKERVSRASLLIGGRYLVEVMVSNTKDATDAVKVIEAMKLASLARTSKSR